MKQLDYDYSLERKTSSFVLFASNFVVNLLELNLSPLRAAQAEFLCLSLTFKITS